MSLSKKQAEFARKVSLLIQFAFEKGYRVTFGEAYRMPDAPHGHPQSLHKSRLAIDLNLFKPGVVGWKYCTKSEDYQELGDFWESIGGSWGGRFNDGNHFSLYHNGMR